MQRIRGIVKKGCQRGRKLGFPTANVEINESFPEGIYISKITVNGGIYPSLTFIGKAETFSETNYQSETYIFDFNQDIYNKLVNIKLIEKIRDNQKFYSVKELIKQMQEDEKITREYFKGLNSKL